MLKSHEAGQRAPLPYRADITSAEAWEKLQNTPAGVLVDVRTTAEWQQVGVPDETALENPPVFLSWITFPEMDINPSFRADLAKAVPDKNTPLFFICKAGGRSMQAAAAMTAQGYTECYNIQDGFEGFPSDTTSGWKSAGLPWRMK